MADSTMTIEGSGNITTNSDGTTATITFNANSIYITNCGANSGDFTANPSTLSNQPAAGTAQDVNYTYNGTSIPAGTETVYLNPTANSNPIGPTGTGINIRGGTVWVWPTGENVGSSELIKGSMTYKPTDGL